jgi:hypothetical protein
MRWVMAAVIFAAIGMIGRPVAAQLKSYSWRIGDPSPQMTNNNDGYCWLGGVEGPFAYPSDYVNLTFDAKWNWIFTGAQGPGEGPPFNAIFAYAWCLPWPSLTTSSNTGADYGYNAYEGRLNIPDPPESMCGIEGFQGPLSQTQSTDVLVNALGYMSSSGPTRVWGQCVHLGFGSSTPKATYYIADSGFQWNEITVDLGEAANRMCTLASLANPPTDYKPYVQAGVYVMTNDSGQAHWYLTNVMGTAEAACISLPQH